MLADIGTSRKNEGFISYPLLQVFSNSVEDTTSNRRCTLLDGPFFLELVGVPLLRDAISYRITRWSRAGGKLAYESQAEQVKLRVVGHRCATEIVP
jgi:hypothetical protein